MNLERQPVDTHPSDTGSVTGPRAAAPGVPNFKGMMKILELTGDVAGTEGQWDGHWLENPEGPTIGGTYLIEAFNKTFPVSEYREKPLTVMLAYGGSQELYKGTAWAMEGDHGWSTWTPGSSPDFWVGGVEGGRSTDLLEKLESLEGQTVHLRIDDGPALSATEGPQDD